MSDPNQSQDPLLLDHNYDGIGELDNKLPRWWVWLFYGSIVFAVVYMSYYHVFHLGDLQEAQYLKEWKAGEAIKAATMSKFEASFPDLQPSTDQQIIETGRQLFLQNCKPCHRADGGGLVGPNLCKTNNWIHGPKFSDNLTTIWNGVPAKGMITWKKFLKPDEVYSVASYIYTLRTTHPVNPKPPQTEESTKPSAFD